MRNVFIMAAILLGGCQMGGMMDAASHEHITVMPDQIKWQSGPAGLPPGAKFAVLEGDPKSPGFFTMRASVPANYRIAPHVHPGAERVTVLSGTLYLGHGDRFDEAAAKAFPAGSYTAMPAGMHHFAYTKEETVIQISTLGPWGITYINPADDPRNSGK